jgi:hypothetical protein
VTVEEGDRVAAAYGSNYERVVEIKRKYFLSESEHIRTSNHSTPGLTQPTLKSFIAVAGARLDIEMLLSDIKARRQELHKPRRSPLAATIGRYH